MGGAVLGARLSRAPGGVAGVGDRKVMQLRAPGGGYASVASQAGFGPTPETRPTRSSPT